MDGLPLGFYVIGLLRGLGWLRFHPIFWGRYGGGELATLLLDRI